jgi:hypothetical protein
MPGLEDAIKRAVDTNVQYYRTVGRVTVDYWRAVLALLSDVKLPIDLTKLKVGTPTVTVTPTPPPAAASGISLSLEAALGEQAIGAFLVDNKLPRAISGPVSLSPFTDDQGRVVSPTATADPATVTLDPGGQKVVQIFVTIDQTLAVGVTYRAEATVTGLQGGRVQLVLRRRPDPIKVD